MGRLEKQGKGRFSSCTSSASSNLHFRPFRSLSAEGPGSEGGQRKALPREIPLRRFGKPEDVAAAVRFLANSEAGYITGSVLKIDGEAIEWSFDSWNGNKTEEELVDDV